MTRCLLTICSDGQERPTEAGDGGRPLQHPAAEEEAEGEETTRPQEGASGATGRGEIIIFIRTLASQPENSLQMRVLEVEEADGT